VTWLSGWVRVSFAHPRHMSKSWVTPLTTIPMNFFCLQSGRISEKIGYPEWLFNDTRLDEEYEGVSTLL